MLFFDLGIFFPRWSKEKKYADLFAEFTWSAAADKRKSTLIQPNRSALFFRAYLRKPFFSRSAAADKKKRTADLSALFFL